MLGTPKKLATSLANAGEDLLKDDKIVVKVRAENNVTKPDNLEVGKGHNDITIISQKQKKLMKSSNLYCSKNLKFAQNDTITI